MGQGAGAMKAYIEGLTFTRVAAMPSLKPAGAELSAGQRRTQ